MNGKNSPKSAGLSGKTLLGCSVLTVLGVLIVLGCSLALYLEASGLGVPRDMGMRPSYTALLVLGSVAGVLIPGVVWFHMVRKSRR